MLELKDCLTPEELAKLDESFPSGLAPRIVEAMVQEKHFEWLDRESRRNKRVPVPVILASMNPYRSREEREVDSVLARILLKAAECFANAKKI